MTEHPTLVIPHEYTHVEAHLLDRLRDAGFRVYRTFCLSEARTSGGVCTCPHHGSMACTCEWCTYLVYDHDGHLVATLTLYGHDERTRITWKGESHRLTDLDAVLEAVQASIEGKSSSSRR